MQYTDDSRYTWWSPVPAAHKQRSLSASSGGRPEGRPAQSNEQVLWSWSQAVTEHHQFLQSSSALPGFLNPQLPLGSHTAYWPITPNWDKNCSQKVAFRLCTIHTIGLKRTTWHLLKFLKINFWLWVFVCMYICAPCMCLVQVEVRKDFEPPGNGVSEFVSL